MLSTKFIDNISPLQNVYYFHFSIGPPYPYGATPLKLCFVLSECVVHLCRFSCQQHNLTDNIIIQFANSRDTKGRSYCGITAQSIFLVTQTTILPHQLLLCFHITSQYKLCFTRGYPCTRVNPLSACGLASLTPQISSTP